MFISIDAAMLQWHGLGYCASEAPGLPIIYQRNLQLPTETLNFWEDEGLERVVLAREVSMDEIKKCRKVDVEIETFIHGAMYLFRTLLLLSNHMVHRDANRGEW